MYYRRNVITVIERKVLLIYNYDMYKDYEENITETNVMHSLMGYKADPVIKSIVQAKTSGKEWWRKMSRNGETQILTSFQI